MSWHIDQAYYICVDSITAAEEDMCPDKHEFYSQFQGRMDPLDLGEKQKESVLSSCLQGYRYVHTRNIRLFEFFGGPE